MDFKSNFMIFNGVYMSTSEVREKYYNAFHYNLVTVLIPKENGEYDLYPRLNFGAKKDDKYFEQQGHANCFRKINELLLRDGSKFYVQEKFEGILDRYIIANMFLNKGMGIIMRTAPDNFVLMMPTLSTNKQLEIATCDKILKLMDLLNIKNGQLQINGTIFDNINDFKKYCKSLNNINYEQHLKKGR